MHGGVAALALATLMVVLSVRALVSPRARALQWPMYTRIGMLLDQDVSGGDDVPLDVRAVLPRHDIWCSVGELEEAVQMLESVHGPVTGDLVLLQGYEETFLTVAAGELRASPSAR